MIFWLFFSAFLEDRIFWNCSQKISFSRNHLSCSEQTSSLMVSITRWRKDERHKQQHKLWWEITSENSCIWDTEHVCAILQNKGKSNKEVKSVSSVWGYFSVPGSRCTRGECATGQVSSPVPFPAPCPWGREQSTGHQVRWGTHQHIPCSGQPWAHHGAWLSPELRLMRTKSSVSFIFKLDIY